jgi:DNA polymerase I-like protein with 3'-5' exonuclease and polymerase domains
MDVFRSGGDFHSSIAKQVFDLKCEVEDVKEYYPLQRQAAKAVSFGIMYGAGPAKIAEQVSKDSGKPFSIGQAKKVISKYFRTYHKLQKWITDNQKFIHRNAFIYSHFGRKRRLLDVRSTDRGISGNALRSGLNFLVQSVASDVNFLACIDMEKIIREKDMQAKIFAVVHDSILAEVPEDEVDLYCSLLQSCVQKDRGVSIPGSPIKCDFDIGDDYSFGKYEKMYGDI